MSTGEGKQRRKTVAARATTAEVRELKRRTRKTRVVSSDSLMQSEDGAGLFGVSDEAEARVAELQRRFDALLTWGVKFKLPKNAETIADVEKHLAAWKAGKKDETQIVGLTADVRRLELLAIEAAAAAKEAAFKPEPATTTFDIERATAGNAAAAAVGEAARDAQQFAGDAAKTALDGVERTASAVPTWLWVAGGVGVVLFGLSQVTKLAETAERFASKGREAGR